MRYNPFLGSISPKNKKMRKQKGLGVESDKYLQEWYDDPSRIPPSRNCNIPDIK
jgi:hypothetical protein